MFTENEMLLRSELFEGLDADAVRSMLALVELRTFAVSERIAAEGQRASQVFYVVRGLVRLTKAESGGREADVCVCEQGDTFAEYLVPGGDVYAQGAWAADITELALFDLSGLRQLAAENSGVQRNVMRIMARHLLGSLECIAGDRLHTAAQRVAKLLCEPLSGGDGPGDVPAALSEADSRWKARTRSRGPLARLCHALQCGSSRKG
ncbi:cAMP-binding protein [Rhizobium leguminosarum bv. trifolii WSM597]|uniref:cAMP-binding protein n=1 Tax=Rhizobium leguminosarum bv. trifolii WSM597 TaxID=754764 RepID=I9XDP5_RHILT|nr:cAMP-binding protein [Rhizobium leguminosarum bv. trifolii WSM597]